MVGFAMQFHFKIPWLFKHANVQNWNHHLTLYHRQHPILFYSPWNEADPPEIVGSVVFVSSYLQWRLPTYVLPFHLHIDLSHPQVLCPVIEYGLHCPPLWCESQLEIYFWLFSSLVMQWYTREKLYRPLISVHLNFDTLVAHNIRVLWKFKNWTTFSDTNYKYKKTNVLPRG